MQLFRLVLAAAFTCTLAWGSPEASKLCRELSEDVAQIQINLKPLSRFIGNPVKSFLQLSTLQQASPGVAKLQGLANAAVKLEAAMASLAHLEKKWKAKIVAANRVEKEEKSWYLAMASNLEAKSKAWKPENGINTYANIKSYWTRHRALENKQYHNLLRIAHAGIAKFKSTIHAVQSAQATAHLRIGSNHDEAAASLAPEVVLLAVSSSLRSLDAWTHVAAKDLEATKSMLLGDSTDNGIEMLHRVL